VLNPLSILKRRVNAHQKIRLGVPCPGNHLVSHRTDYGNPLSCNDALVDRRTSLQNDTIDWQPFAGTDKNNFTSR